MIENLKEKISTIGLDELKQIKDIVSEEIERKTIVKRVIYTHSCVGSSRSHFYKYKHWAKTIMQIDDNKADGYAFIGDFLKVESENLVKIGAYVVEFCSGDLTLYKVEGEGKFQLLLEGKTKYYVTFIKEAKKITGL